MQIPGNLRAPFAHCGGVRPAEPAAERKMRSDSARYSGKAPPSWALPAYASAPRPDVAIAGTVALRFARSGRAYPLPVARRQWEPPKQAVEEHSSSVTPDL